MCKKVMSQKDGAKKLTLVKVIYVCVCICVCFKSSTCNPLRISTNPHKAKL